MVVVALAFVSRVSAGVRLQVLQTALVALPEWLKQCYCESAALCVLGCVGCWLLCLLQQRQSVGASLGVGGVAVVCQWVNVCTQMATR